MKADKLLARESRILAYQNNILATYRRATADNISDGKQWYARAKGRIDAILEEYGISRGKFAYQAFSALSPRISYQENVEGFAKFIKAHASRVSSPPVVAGTESNRLKAWQYITGDATQWIDCKNAPKTCRFALNLAGDLSHVTVDVWAARAAGFTKESIRGNDYLDLEEAYKRVAKSTGFEPAELQAIAWIVTRGKGE